MKKTLISAIVICLALCACTPKAQLSGSFICGEADAAALCDAGLFTVRRCAVKCFDGTGELIFERTLEPDTARITKSSRLAAAYTEGGQSLVFSDGELISTSRGIISAALSETGYIALCTDESGYMGSVTVYSPDKKALYKWYSAHQALVSAAVSPDGTRLAVLTDKAVRLFRLDSEAECGSFECAGLRDIVWLGERVCCIGGDSLYVCNDEGSFKGKRGFSGKMTGKFGVLDRKLIIEVSGNTGDEKTDVYILDDSLDIKNRISAGGELWYLDCRNDKMALLTQNEVSVYSDEGKLLRSEDASGASMVLLSDDGDILAIGGGSVEMKNS